MTTLTRTSFLRDMQNQRIEIQAAQRDPQLAGLNFTALDQNRNGYVTGSREMDALFTAIDQFDVNGSGQSVEIGSSTSPTTAGKMITALRALASATPGVTGYRDNALAAAFPRGFSGQLANGAAGNSVVAVQYALGRLGYLHDLCDGQFGGLTEQAIKAFQTQHALPVSGVADVVLVGLLDNAVSVLDLRTPAAKASNPLAYLSDFQRRGLPEIRLNSTAENFSWASPAIQRAFGTFVENYWQVMKQNQVEGDCKNIALFFMDQFRQQLKADRMVDLPHPALARAAEKNWIVATTDKTQGLFTRVDRLARTTGLRVDRPGYDAVKKVQALDPQQSMLFGVNVHYPEISADRVAKSTVRLFDWHPAWSNQGDSSQPEVPVNQMAAGNVIFIDHTGDGKYDHTVTVVRVEKDSSNRARKLVLAVGSYDDVRDNSSATSVEGTGFSVVNTYSEEVTVTLDSNGRITRSEVTYSSEPDYLVDTRYSARTTLMEQRSGGKLFVARWG